MVWKGKDGADGGKGKEWKGQNLRERQAKGWKGKAKDWDNVKTGRKVTSRNKRGRDEDGAG